MADLIPSQHVGVRHIARESRGVDDRALSAWLSRVAPVLVSDDGTVRRVVGLDPKTQAFTSADDDDMVPFESALVAKWQIETVHTCAYHGFFKPAAAEVFVQTPRIVLVDDEIVAFTTKPRAEGWGCVVDGGRAHLGITTFFARATEGRADG